MAAGIVAFFTALPAIVELLSRLGLALNRLLEYSKKNNLEGWISDLEKSIDELEAAKNADEKLGAAQSLVGVIRNLGSSSSKL